jgi:hypothetical protein
VFGDGVAVAVMVSLSYLLGNMWLRRGDVQRRAS